ncbi:VWA domain-containing protein [Stappia indica]|uniref:VWA domain-containing protein n=1 Tax=Stappia indica TaxID=538381 RepID=UPI001CD6AD95|nr:VWA domain-containing protein [Stappia indica]MCA1299806.1 VWA domain-containing protein [Stappia indica]
MQLFKPAVLAIATLGATAALTAADTTAARATEDVMVVYDASGSMWGQIDGVSKIEIAREVLGDLIATWPEKANVGLMAYGHRREADCTDIETLIAPVPLDRSAFVAAIGGIKPRGRTPLTDAIRQAAEQLSYRDTRATVILISDGLETCQADPCALSAELARQGVKFTAHVVGFDLTEEEHAGLACIAENTGGVFVPAKDAAGLKKALSHVQDVMDLKPVAQEEAKAEPELPHLDDPDIALEAPAQVTAGARFDVAWSSSISPQDYLAIVVPDAKEGAYINYLIVEDQKKGGLMAPAKPGLYEVRYVLNDGNRTLNAVPVEVVAAEIGITAPAQVTAGARFNVSWSSVVHPRDYLAIAPAGAKEGTYINYLTVDGATEGGLVAPAEPGLYEVRYVLQEDNHTVTSVPVEVVEAEMGISAPAQVTAGARFNVSWSSVVHPQDYVAIASAGAEEGAYVNYLTVDGATEGGLVAPAEPGLYEVRYVLQEDNHTLTSTPLEVVDAKVSLTGPDVASAKAPVRISWSVSIHPQDYITIVPAGADEGAYQDYFRVEDNRQDELAAPAEPGLYEIRYVLQQGNRTVARQALKVVDAAAPVME